jgi:hypothetical protein
MDRSHRLLRRIFVFGALGLAFLAALVLRPSRDAESLPEARLAATFPPIDVAKVRALEVERPAQGADKPASSVRLLRLDATKWQVESKGGYPADAKKVEDYLRSLASVRTKSTPTTNPEKFKNFAGPDGWTEVRVYEEAETPSISFGVGKSGAEGSWSSLYLRIDDVGKAGLPSSPLGAPGATPPPTPGRIVVASGYDAYGDRTELSNWVDARLWPGLDEAAIQEIEWRHPSKSFEGRLVRGVRGEKDLADPWTLSGSHAGPARAASATLRAQQFAGLQFQTVVGKKPPGDDLTYGLGEPDLVVTVTGKPAREGELPPTWRLTLGTKVEGKEAWYAQRTGPTGEDGYVFTVGGSETSYFRDDPKDLLETPPAPPEAAGMGEEPPAPQEPPAMGEPPPAPPAEPAPGETPVPPAMGEEK